MSWSGPQLRSPAVERAVREEALRRLRQSPERWAEYRRRSRNTWLRVMGWIVLVPAILLGGIMMPMSFSVVVVGMGRVISALPDVGEDDGPIDPVFAQGNVPSLALACQALVFTGWTIAVAAARKPIGRRSRFGTLAFFPIGDRTFFREQMLENFGNGVFIWVCALPAYGLLLWFGDFAPGVWLTGVALALVQAATILAGLHLAVNRLPGHAASIGVLVGMAIVCVGAAGGMAGPWVVHFAGAIVWPVFSLTPSGWVNGAFCFGLMEGRPAGWLFLVPAVGLIAYVARRSWVPSAIREFVFDSQGAATLVYEPGSNRLGYAEADERRPGSASPPPAPVASDPRQHVAVSQRILSRDFLRPADEDHCDMVSQFARRCFSNRERTIREYGPDRRVAWGVAWRWTLVAWAILMAMCVATAPCAPGNRGLGPLLVFSGVHFLALPGHIRFRDLRRQEPVTATASGLVHLFYPVSLAEILDATRKSTLLRALLYGVPWMVLTTTAGWLHGPSALAGMADGALSVLIYAVVVPIGVCMWFSASSSDTARWSIRVAWYLAAGCGLLLATFAVMVPFPWIQWPFVGLLCAVVWPFVRFYRRAYGAMRFDMAYGPYAGRR